MKNQVILSVEEATEILNLLRTVQMEIGGVNLPAEHPLASLAFLGALNQAVNGLEGSIWESGMPPMPNLGDLN